MTTNYHFAIIFAKHTNLLPWFDAQHGIYSHLSHSPVEYDRARAMYARDRDVQLILLVRYELGRAGRPYCKIKCPINPLPVRGEFEAASLSYIIKFLQNDGWTMKQKLPITLLK